MPKIFEKAGLQEKYSNHPLPATRMFNAGIQYKESNAEQSGHQSLKALRSVI